MNTIEFAIHPCSLGLVLVGRTTRGACAVFLGDDADMLRRELERRFSPATLLHATLVPPAGRVGAGAALSALVRHVRSLVESPARAADSPATDIPLDMRGTPFQRRVWQALRDIPAGSTSSYADIAKRVGAPTAVRAVANACGANPLAVLVPCHRVIATGGKPSGYRWGIERKRALLRREAGTAEASPAIPLGLHSSHG